jgi:hypothetical protein
MPSARVLMKLLQPALLLLACLHLLFAVNVQHPRTTPTFFCNEVNARGYLYGETLRFPSGKGQQQ